MKVIEEETDSSLNSLAASVFDSFIHHLVPLAHATIDPPLSEPLLWRLLDVCKRAVVGPHHRLPSDTLFTKFSSSSSERRGREDDDDERKERSGDDRKDSRPQTKAQALHFISCILELVVKLGFAEIEFSPAHVAKNWKTGESPCFVVQQVADLVTVCRLLSMCCSSICITILV